MNTDAYRSLWATINPEMLDLMELVRTQLMHENRRHFKQFHIGPVTLQTDSEEFSLMILIEDIFAGDVAVLAISFSLCANQGGANVRLCVDDLLRKTSSMQYMPRNLSADCYTTDALELLGRIKLFPMPAIYDSTSRILHSLNFMRKEHGHAYSQALAQLR